MALLKSVYALVALCAFACAADTIGDPGPDYPPRADGKAPFRMIYSNDTTNLFTCPSPYRPVSDDYFGDHLIEASVREAAVGGMDAQMIQPGTGWVVWWQSKKFPFDKQLEWFEGYYGKRVPGGGFLDYQRNGGDVVRAFINACRMYNQAAFVSYRLNDLHHVREAWEPKTINPMRAMYLSEFYCTHPEYKLGKGLGVVNLAQNWMIPEVRNHKWEMIDELVRTYDLDGLELDFQRGSFMFVRTRDGAFVDSLEAREAAVLDFVKKVRASLDAGARNGRKRWLSVRVPAERGDWGRNGFNPVTWRAAGVDIFNLSPSYCTTLETDVAHVRQLVPDATIYVELTHCATRWKIDVHAKKLAENYRRSDALILENAARTAYARGADGLSFFNFVYYRGGFGQRPENAGAGAEPPFELFSRLDDPKKLSAPPYYFYAPDERFPDWEKKMTQGDAPFVFALDTVAPPRKDGVFRMQLVADAEKFQREMDNPDPDTDRGLWEISINGKILKPVENTWDIPFYETEYPGGMGDAIQYRTWRVPAGTLVDGVNTVSVRLRKAKQPLWIRWTEVFFP